MLDDWSLYTERLQLYFIVNDTQEAKQKANLFSRCGVATYRLIKNLTAPEKPQTETFGDCEMLPLKHKLITSKERHLTRYCNFGNSLKEMLHDRLVCGIENGPIQHSLLENLPSP